MPDSGKVVITGGAGFIGCNAAKRYLNQGREVVVIDDLSRNGTSQNLAWIKAPGLHFHNCDICDFEDLLTIFARHQNAAVLLHLAGQVAVTTSVSNPREDFESNALGSFNVLECARQFGLACPILYASTNKVYGGLEQTRVALEGDRYAFPGLPSGIPETQPIDFHSPYGCSKGAADQYFRDYHRIYGLNTVVLRQSCIYGYRQFGIEDQGWVAWFTIAAALGRPVTIYGDGKQVRDVLFIDDLLDAYDAAAARISVSSGKIYNIGGGPRNVLSLLELAQFLKQKHGDTFQYSHADWRPGDQRAYISDIRLAADELGWAPRIDVSTGLNLLHSWVTESRELFSVPSSR